MPKSSSNRTAVILDFERACVASKNFSLTRPLMKGHLLATRGPLREFEVRAAGCVARFPEARL